MAILKKEKEKVLAAREESTSTHFPNETKKAPEDSGKSVLNNQVPETLIDPEDDEGGSTHFNNEEKYSEKSNRMNGGKTTAAADGDEKKVDPRKSTPKKHPGEVKLAKQSEKKHPAKAGLEEDTPDAGADPDYVQGPDADAEFTEESPDSGVEEVIESDVEGGDGCDETGQQDTQHMPNDVDPAAGYLTVGDAPDAKTAPTLPNAQSGDEFEDGDGANPQSDLTVESDVGDVDEFDDAMEDPGATHLEEVDDTDLGDAGAEDMALLDVDGADDEADDVVFANIGTSVKVIKANRIIASMGKKAAAKAGCANDYLSDNFATVTASLMEEHGVRAGLKKMGFVLATVNLAKADVLNKRVEAKATKLTAGLRAQAEEQTESMEQCLAIAAVGINRAGYFKDVRNELRAALEDEFSAAGVRGAEKLIRRVFASKGVDYAKAILTIANQLKEKPLEVRNAFANALDMTGDEDSGMDELSVGDPASMTTNSLTNLQMTRVPRKRFMRLFRVLPTRNVMWPVLPVTRLRLPRFSRARHRCRSPKHIS
jgi:hypothetical protein